MQAVPDTLIAIGFLAFLIGTVWVTAAYVGHRSWEFPTIVTVLTGAVLYIGGIFPLEIIGFLVILIGIVWVFVTRLGPRGWKPSAIITTLSVAVMNIGGLIALSDVFGHYHSVDPGFNLYPSTVQETVAYYLMLLGLLTVLVGMVWVIGALFRRAGRKIPTVMVGLGLALMLQGGILQLLTYVPPHNHALAASAEKDNVQTAMDAMMAFNGISSVTRSINSTNSWSDNPTGTSAVPLFPFILQDATTIYFYCWDSTGAITHQDESSTSCEPTIPARRVRDRG